MYIKISIRARSMSVADLIEQRKSKWGTLLRIYVVHTDVRMNF